MTEPTTVDTPVDAKPTPEDTGGRISDLEAKAKERLAAANAETEAQKQAREQAEKQASDMAAELAQFKAEKAEKERLARIEAGEGDKMLGETEQQLADQRNLNASLMERVTQLEELVGNVVASQVAGLGEENAEFAQLALAGKTPEQQLAFLPTLQKQFTKKPSLGRETIGASDQPNDDLLSELRALEKKQSTGQMTAEDHQRKAHLSIITK